MTTIIARMVREPYPAIVMGTDLQSSYRDPVVTSDAILFRDRKSYKKKLIQTPDDAIVFAMTGAETDQYKTFMREVLGEQTKIPSFNLVDELRSGRSRTLGMLNDSAMRQNDPSTINTKNCFHLAVAYRTENSLELWQVSETGVAVPQTALAMGSGTNDAAGANNVLTDVGYIPDCYKTELSKTAYVIFRAIEYATSNDRSSSGNDVVVVSHKGIESLTKKLWEMNRPIFDAHEKEVISDLDKSN